ncbi:MAG: HDIG domain-containing protein, partial [Euryarchaeota archaeon]|nr:HDIG domain-containing protein [Euryarchaeota archaeon]
MTPEDAINLLREAGCSQDIIEHCQTVAEYACEIAEQYNKKHRRHDNPTPADIELVMIGALLHDIGRARSQKIKHVVIGAKIARSLKLDERIVRIIERHI